MRRVATVLIVLISLALVLFIGGLTRTGLIDLTGLVIGEPSDLPVDCTSGTLTTLYADVFKNDASYAPQVVGGGSTCANSAFVFNNTNNNASSEIRIIQMTYNSASEFDFIAYYYNISGSVVLPNDVNSLKAFTFTPVSRDSAVSSTSAANTIFTNLLDISVTVNDWNSVGDTYNATSVTTSGGSVFTKEGLVFKSVDETKYFYDKSAQASNSVSWNGVNIPNFNTTEDVNISNAFDLDTYFTTSGSVSFNFNTNVSNSVDFEVDSNRVVRIVPKPDWYGSVGAYVVGTAGSTNAASNNFTVNVNAVNEAPRLIKNFPNFTWLKNANKNIDLRLYFKEPDGDDMRYYHSALQHIDVRFDLEDDDALLDPEENWVGTENVFFYANDSFNNSRKSNQFKLEVTTQGGAGNIAPIIVNKTPSSNLVALDVGDVQTFSIVVQNDDNDILTYAWKLNGANQNRNASSYTYSATAAGNFKLEASVNDGYFDDVSTGWNITVSSIATDVGAGANLSNQSDATSRSTFLPNDKKGLFIYLVIGLSFIAVMIILIVFIPRIIKMGTKPKKNVARKIVSDEEKINARPMGQAVLISKEEPQVKDNIYSIIEFIKKYRSKGVSMEDIKAILIENGWGEEQIDEAFKKVGSSE